MSTESYTAVATQARNATEKSVEVWKNGAAALSNQANAVSALPILDLTEPVARYFEYVQRSVDLSRELVTTWAETVASLTGSIREQATQVGHIVTDQTRTVADIATDQARRVEEHAEEQAAQIEQAEKEQARLARKAERDEAKRSHQQAREPYEGLTKAELSEQLAARELPRTGTVDELVERLVAADTGADTE